MLVVYRGVSNGCRIFVVGGTLWFFACLRARMLWSRCARVLIVVCVFRGNGCIFLAVVADCRRTFRYLGLVSICGGDPRLWASVILVHRISADWRVDFWCWPDSLVGLAS